MANAKCTKCGTICPEATLYPAEYFDPQNDRPFDQPQLIEPAGECPVCGHYAYKTDDRK